MKGAEYAFLVAAHVVYGSSDGEVLNVALIIIVLWSFCEPSKGCEKWSKAWSLSIPQPAVAFAGKSV